jgi:hypothetical protein
MNKRIQQLIDQANDYANEQNELYGLSYEDEYNKKFAELIIRECIDIAHTNGDNLDYLNKHFGVN